MRVLIVKVSSMGDIIHTLPAVTDAYRAKRGIRFDWVVEEAFTDIPSWHPGVDRIIPVALRRWRKSPFKTWRNGEFAAFKQNLKHEHYDLVIDAQGLLKSALIGRIARGLTVGMSNRAIREPLATLFYNVMYTVPWQQHAVERVRDLFSRTFNYSLDYHTCDYGLDARRFLPSKLESATAPEKYLMFFHGTTWDSKLWPLPYWQALTKLANAAGYGVKLLWGNEVERQRAVAIASAGTSVEILNQQSLTNIASILAQSAGVVAVDTGLAHLAAALTVPTVSLYGASDPSLTGTYGRRQLHLKGSLACSPCRQRQCAYNGDVLEDELAGQRFAVTPACFRAHPPALVWQKLTDLMAGGAGTLDGLFYPN
jgi:heptosyltransferase I